MDDDDNNPRYGVDELASLAGLNTRTVRYYIQQGLIDRPFGEKRGAYYVQRHLEQLIELRKWQEAGLSLDRIREILHAPGSGTLPPARRREPGSVEVWSHLYVADGVELMLEPGRSGLSPEAVREFTRGVMALYEHVLQKEQKGK
ncbi:MAG TPA: MerR family transcriptional regulator [Burkholderiaceae bacterium]